jgi:hypothetical protein
MILLGLHVKVISANLHLDVCKVTVSILWAEQIVSFVAAPDYKEEWGKASLEENCRNGEKEE